MISVSNSIIYTYHDPKDRYDGNSLLQVSKDLERIELFGMGCHHKMDDGVSFPKRYIRALTERMKE